MKVDLHTHILPKTWPDLRQRYGQGGFPQLEHVSPCCARIVVDGQFFRQISDNTWCAEKRIAECDATGVSVQVLSTVPVMFSYWSKPQHGHDLARLLNDHLAEVVGQHPKRFVGLGTIPLQDTDLAVQELERCCQQLGFAGVQIGTHVNGWNLDHPAIRPVFARAEALGAAVFVHPWDMVGQERMSKYWLPWLVGMPAETAVAICSVIFSGVLEQFPKLKLAFAHGGGAFPYLVGRIEHGFLCRPDLCAVDNPHNPRRYLGKFYLDSLVHDESALRYLINLVGADRIALGSDYPFPLGESEPGAMIQQMTDLCDATKDQLLWKTALDFLGRPRSDFE